MALDEIGRQAETRFDIVIIIPGDFQAFHAERPNDDDPPFWLNWTKFDYLYVLFSEEGAANPDPQRLTLVVEGENFQLYRVLKVPQVRAEE